MEFATNQLEISFKNFKKMTKRDICYQALKYLIIIVLVMMFFKGVKSVTGLYFPITMSAVKALSVILMQEMLLF